MRIVSWNCCGSLKSEEKLSFLLNLNPDIAIIQEARETDIEGEQKVLWRTNQPDKNNPKGLGIYKFNPDVQITTLPTIEDFELLQPIGISSDDIKISLVAIWAYNKRSQGIYKGKRGMMIDAVDAFSEFTGESCLWIGDFNNGPTIAEGKYWDPVVNKLADKKMNLLTFPGSTPTHKNNKGTLHQIDHLFAGENIAARGSLTPRISLEDAPSDHVPLVLDISPFLCYLPFYEQIKQPRILRHKRSPVPREEQRHRSNLTFERNFAECVNKSLTGQCQLAIISQEITIDEVKKVCYSGNILPQKSTYFYPKVICGFLFGSIHPDEFTSSFDSAFHE